MWPTLPKTGMQPGMPGAEGTWQQGDLACSHQPASSLVTRAVKGSGLPTRESTDYSGGECWEVEKDPSTGFHNRVCTCLSFQWTP